MPKCTGCGYECGGGPDDECCLTHIADWDATGHPEYRVEIGSTTYTSSDGRRWIDAHGQAPTGAAWSRAVILLRDGPHDGTVLA